MLQVLKRLFDGLDQAGLEYVIWKSLENYATQLEGDGDVDVLFVNDDRDRLDRYFLAHGFPEDHGTVARVAEQIRVYRGFDAETGRHTSIHAYFECRFGSKRYKEFRFPHEQQMLEGFEMALGARRLEQGLFIVTRFLMVSARNVRDDAYVVEMAQQYKSLTAAQREIVDNHLRNYFDTEAAEVMARIHAHGAGALADFHGVVTARLSEAHPVELVKNTVDQYRGRDKKLFRLAARGLGFSRNKLGVSLSIVLTGHDGTGKTTVSRVVERQLAAVAPCRRIYLGRNRWSSLNTAIDACRLKPGCRLANWIWPYTSTLEIILRLAMGKLRVLLGWIVVYDRSILDLLLKYEGRRVIGGWFPRRVARWLAPNEATACYLLQADASVVIERKARHTKEEIEQKRSQYERLTGDHYQVIDTTDQTVEQVSSRIIGDIFRQAGHRALSR